nr:MAG TPA: hypothetical protein [Caudoviricetes sp.]
MSTTVQWISQVRHSNVEQRAVRAFVLLCISMLHENE